MKYTHADTYTHAHIALTPQMFKTHGWNKAVNKIDPRYPSPVLLWARHVISKTAGQGGMESEPMAQESMSK